MPLFPDGTMIGALMNYIHTPTKNFQPMNANMGVVPVMPRPKGPRKTRYLAVAQRAEEAMRAFRADNDGLFPPSGVRA